MSLYSVKVSLKLRAGVAQRPIFATGWQSVYVPRQDSHPHPLQKIYRTKLFCIHYTEHEGLLQCLKAKYLHHLQKDMDAIDYNIHVV